MAAQGGAGATGLLVGGGIAAGVAAVAGLIWALQPTPEPVADTQDVPSVAVPLLAAPAPVAAPVAEPAPEPAALAHVAEPAPPSFDTVRVTPAGEALVAGRAGPGTTVLLRVDGAEAARAMADSQGNFVAMFTLPPSDQPRLLALAEAGPPEILSDQTVALAPTGGMPEVPPPGAAAPEAMPPAEPEAPLALLVTDQGVQVLQSDPAPVAGAGADVAVDAISYTPDGGVQLSGHGAGGATVRLYLEDAPVAEALVSGTGQWFATLRDVTPGLYTLRADQIGPDGKVTARFETPFLRETPEALAAALKPQATPGTPLSAQVPVATPVASAVPQPATSEAAERPVSVTVQPGFTLWRIARERFGDGVMYVQVFEANKAQIRDPDLIYPGQVFTIPQP